MEGTGGLTLTNVEQIEVTTTTTRKPTAIETMIARTGGCMIWIQADLAPGHDEKRARVSCQAQKV